MNQTIIREEDFLQKMKDEVLPYLNARRTILRVRRKTGQEICCERYMADEPRGIILISHGFTDSAGKYAEIIYYFLRKGYHVYIPEHCGHGRSYRLTDDLSLVHIDRYERYIEDFLAVARLIHKNANMISAAATSKANTVFSAPPQNDSSISAKDCSESNNPAEIAHHTTETNASEEHDAKTVLPLYIFAHSMGGGIAAAAAARKPELFDKVILTAPMIRPLTGSVPYHLAAAITAFHCKTGKGQDYVAGQKPYSGPEDFAYSASLSRPRFEYCQEIKSLNPLCRTSAASNGWLNAAICLSRELTLCSWKAANFPMLILQAEQDSFVSADAQNTFARLRNRKNPGSTVLKQIPGSKHEIFNSSDETTKRYWREVFSFLQCPSSVSQ